MIDYGFVRHFERPLDELLEELPKALEQEGFGVLCRIPIHEKFRDKLDTEFQRYEIFGVCNPPAAHTAITSEINIGLMLPCSVIAYEVVGGCRVGAVKPTVMMQSIDNQELASVAKEIEGRLERVITSLGTVVPHDEEGMG